MAYQLPKDFTIGVLGVPGSGKSTICNSLAQIFNAQKLQESFNEALEQQRKGILKFSSINEMLEYNDNKDIDLYKQTFEKKGNWIYDLPFFLSIPNAETWLKHNENGLMPDFDRNKFFDYAKELIGRFDKDLKFPSLFVLITCDIEETCRRRKERNTSGDSETNHSVNADLHKFINEYVRNELSKRRFVIEVDNTKFRNAEEIAKVIMKYLDKNNGIIKI